MIATIVFFAVLLVYAVLDSLQDKTNTAHNKHPYSHLPWPLIDRWHAIKRTRMYLLSGYTVAFVQFPALRPEPLPWWTIGALAVVALGLWKWIPAPAHWRKP